MAFSIKDIRSSAPGMGSSISRVSVEGLTVVDANLRKLIDRMAEAGYLRVRKVAWDVLAKAKNFVPYDEGKLFDTGKVVQARDEKTGRFASVNGAGSYYVSFGDVSRGVDYALLVHENPGERLTFNQDTKAPPPYNEGPKISHYLKVPADEARMTMLGEVKEEVQSAVIGVLQEVKSMAPRLVKRLK